MKDENINRIEVEANKLLATALVLCTNHFGLNVDFARMIYKVASANTIPYKILRYYDGISDNGDLSVYRLGNPTVIAPCSTLNDIMLEHGIIDLPKEFDIIEVSPSPFNIMVFSYRLTYDALYSIKLLTTDFGILDPESNTKDYMGGFTDVHLDRFIQSTALYQLNSEYFTKKSILK